MHKCSHCNKALESKHLRACHQRWCNPETRPDHSGTKNPHCGRKGKNQLSGKDWSKVPFEELGIRKRREFLMNEADHSCTMCGFSQTRADGRVILQIDHVDGDNSNNARNNLRVLCPNCHAVHSEKFMHIGQPHSQEAKLKISAAVRRRIPSDS